MLLCKSFMGDGNDCVKRNTAFLIGLICDACKEHANIFYQNAGQMLEPLLTSTKLEVKDNAMAAMARMVISNEQQTPNAEAVTALICENVPFTGDRQENATIVKLFL